MLDGFGDKIPVTINDLLRVVILQTSGNAQTYTVRYIVASKEASEPDGRLFPTTLEQIVTVTNVQSTNDFQLFNGVLLGVMISNESAASQLGTDYIHVELRRGRASNLAVNPPSTAYKILIDDYSSQGYNPSWPNKSGQGWGLDRFAVVRNTIPNPAAGANFSYQSGLLEFRKLVSLMFTFVTDATAGNRLVEVTINDGSGNVHNVIAQAVQAPSTTYSYRFQRGLGTVYNANYISVAATVSMNPMPDMFMRNQWTLASQVDNIKGGDQLSSIQLITELQTRGSG